MGVNFVVIVENSKNISLQEFKTTLLQEPVVGPLVWNSLGGCDADELAPWLEFIWEDKTYFTWMFAPRLSTFNVYEFDEEQDEPDAYAITFLKIMLLLEQTAGGPVHIGNDVVQAAHPDEAGEEGGYSFWLPSELDFQLKNWRTIAHREAEPSLIF